MKKIRLLAFASLFVLFATRSGATTIAENFSTNPLQDGGQIFGAIDLFQWDSTNQNLEVTWDSSQSNSYFYHPLGTIHADDFSVQSDLQWSDANARGSFQRTVGLLNFSDAASPNFSRRIGSTPNLFEFYYVSDGGYASLDTTRTDTPTDKGIYRVRAARP